MNARTRSSLRDELTARGFTPRGESPNHSMTLDDAFLDGVDIVDLLDMMVVRRERIFWSPSVVGEEVAKRNYEDVVQIVDAIKTVIKKLWPE